ncbi:hypothetical protein C2S52_013690 [Perilla frutescens var. hirtella]|nr:hypothetical protein C2S52_013690 [Perilla frutescens var. hirtella]
MGSLWDSLLFPAKKLVAPRLLRRYGNFLCNYLKGIEANVKVKLGLSQVEDEAKSLQHLEEVERIIGYSFNNRSLLYQAFTHPSYHRDCVSYERLEYVGDSVLNLLITKEQFSKYPDLPPGLLTPLRAANVDTEKLARMAVRHNFHRYIRFGNPAIYRKKIQAFINTLPKHPLHSHGLISAPKVLADVVESTIGAVYVDSNYSIERTWEVAKKLLEPIISPESLPIHPVTRLLEMCQSKRFSMKMRDSWKDDGVVEFVIDDETCVGKAKYKAKRAIAKNRAALDAYNQITYPRTVLLWQFPCLEDLVPIVFGRSRSVCLTTLWSRFRAEINPLVQGKITNPNSLTMLPKIDDRDNTEVKL